MKFPRSLQWIVLCAASVFLAGTATAKKVDLTGATSTLNGEWKITLRDGGAKLGCDANRTSMSVVFGENRQWSGFFDGQSIGGTWKQRGKGGKKLKVKLDSRSLDVLNQAIDDAVSSCILSIPDGRPVTIRDVKLKATINKKGSKLAVKLVVDFRSQEDGLFWDMAGDTKDVFQLKVKGGVTTVPTSSTPRIVQATQLEVPPVPSDLVNQCFVGPATNEQCPTFPVIEFRGTRYWVYKFFDNRSAMALVGYDSSRNQVSRLEVPGGRYLWGVQIDESAQTISILVQQGEIRPIAWSELR